MNRRFVLKGLTALAASIVLSDVGLFSSQKTHPEFLCGFNILYKEGDSGETGDKSYKESVFAWRELPFGQIECVVINAKFYPMDVLITEAGDFYRVLSKQSTKYLLHKV